MINETQIKDEIITKIRSGVYTSVTQSTIIKKENDKFFNVSTLFLANIKEEKTLIRGKLVINNYTFLDEEITLEEFIERIKQMSNRKIKIQNIYINIGECQFISNNRLPSNNLFSQFAGTIYPIYIPESQNLNESLICYDSEIYFIDGNHALKFWLNLKTNSDHYSYGNGSIFIPNEIYFKEIKLIEDKQISFNFNKIGDNFKLKGYIIEKGKERYFDKKINISPINIEIQDKPEYINFKIIDSKNEIMDSLNTSDFEPYERFQNLFVNYKIKEKIIKYISMGENEVFECKSFISLNPDENKINEIAASIIAMANTKGGTIAIGIDNYLEFQTIKDLRKVFAEKLNDQNLISKYIEKLRLVLRDRMLSSDSDLNYHISPIKFENNIIIGIDIEKGTKIHQTLKGDVFYRRNSNTIRPNSKEIYELTKK